MASFTKTILLSITATLVLSVPYLIERRLRRYESELEDIKKNLEHLRSQLQHNCHISGQYLVSGQNGISDDMVTWSSVLTEYTTKFRMYGANQKAWCPGSKDENQYIQVNFPELKTVTGIVTLEHESLNWWVTTYKVSHKIDGTHWRTYKDDSGADLIFQGNDGSYIPKINCLPRRIVARSIRIHPLSWHYTICMRFDVIGY